MTFQHEPNIQRRRTSIVSLDDNQEVILVDCFSITQDVLAKLLTNRGYKVTCLATGKELIDHVQERRFELQLSPKSQLPVVIVEAWLGELSGFDAARVLKDIVPDLKIIMLTCQHSLEEKLESRIVDKIIMKPVLSEVVDRAIKYVLSLTDLRYQEDKRVML
ncbi:transcriptional regulatory protein ZraR [Acrasis kona]|uniref:Transcriptional regulatory protein ZraR n=1 Tax=Acrasis kona TaxID=1008807 RepID=A0AAW2Z9R4_9EUKA